MPHRVITPSLHCSSGPLLHAAVSCHNELLPPTYIAPLAPSYMQQFHVTKSYYPLPTLLLWPPLTCSSFMSQRVITPSLHCSSDPLLHAAVSCHKELLPPPYIAPLAPSYMQQFHVTKSYYPLPTLLLWPPLTCSSFMPHRFITPSLHCSSSPLLHAAVSCHNELLPPTYIAPLAPSYMQQFHATMSYYPLPTLLL